MSTPVNTIVNRPLNYRGREQRLQHRIASKVVTLVTKSIDRQPSFADTPQSIMSRQMNPAKNGVVALNWSQRSGRLTPNKRELIRPLVENPGDFLFLSIRALAQKLGTDTATTLRI